MIAAFPFALFYGAVYTESLFLLGATGAFYHFRRREFTKAGAWGLLVGLTRPNGCFLSFSLALIAIAPWLPHYHLGQLALSAIGQTPNPQPAWNVALLAVWTIAGTAAAVAAFRHDEGRLYG